MFATKQSFDLDDARHIFQALSSHADYFLTLDEKTILKKYRLDKNLKNFFENGKMKLMNPTELVADLGL
ncbi:hypothetical protein DRO91_06205 [Candidatus Heimdallarchaeota archaeon]|nr:MAG: hypothetical protein DRO91_06205 [Candidatus Heimdallarchaeota archaeon]